MIVRFGANDYIDTKALKELVDEKNEENTSGNTQTEQVEAQ